MRNDGSPAKEVQSRLKLTAILGAAAIVFGVLIMFLFSIMIEAEILPPGAGEMGSMVVIILAAFLASIIAVKRLQSKTLISGLSVSAVILLFLLILGIVSFGGSRQYNAFTLIGIPLTGFVAGLMGGKKHKISKR